jgi:ribosomal protein S6
LNYYEAIYLLDPRLDDEQLAGLKTELRTKFEQAGAQQLSEVRCERKQLAYAIKKQGDATYLIYRFQGPSDAVGRLRTELKHVQPILRMSYVRVPESAFAVPAAPAEATTAGPAEAPTQG